VIGPLLDSHKHDIAAMLRESLETEANALELYRELLALVEGRSIALEEFARQMIYAEELHAAEVDKMLRRPGELATFSQRSD
jgi:bacterioferritin